MNEDHFVAIPRKVAKARGLKYYRTLNACKHGHRVERLVSSRTCVECSRESDRQFQKENPERFREYKQRRRKEDPERFREYDQRWRKKP